LMERDKNENLGHDQKTTKRKQKKRKIRVKEIKILGVDKPENARKRNVKKNKGNPKTPLGRTGRGATKGQKRKGGITPKASKFFGSKTAQCNFKLPN